MNNRDNDKDINEIIPHLYISNWDTSNNPEIIRFYNIKAVITLETTNKPTRILRYYYGNKIDFMHIQIIDSKDSDIDKHFDSTYNFIQKHISKNENVLIHCAAGISRSATIILNYILRNMFLNYNLKQENPENILIHALNIARSKRPIINPNPGFINQLLEKIKYYKLYQIYDS